MNAIDESQPNSGVPQAEQSSDYLMADAAPDAIFLVDERAAILRANRSAHSMFGYSPRELIGETIFRVIAPKDCDRLMRRLTRDLIVRPTRAQEPARFECDAVDKTGRPFPVEVTLQQVRSRNRSEFVAVIRDASERKSSEKRIEQLHKEAHGSQQMQSAGKLALLLAPELNNLLTVIIGFSEVLLERFRDQDSAKLRVESIKKAANRAAALLKQLLAFAREHVANPKILDMNAIVFDSCKVLQTLLGRQIELVLRLKPSVGRVLVDAAQIEQAIFQLCLNARDAMPGGGRLTIQTASLKINNADASLPARPAGGHYVALAVHHTGSLLRHEPPDHLSESPVRPGSQHSPAEKLMSVRGIVKRAGGFMRVLGEPRQGATFEVFLPRMEDASEPA